MLTTYIAPRGLPHAIVGGPEWVSRCQPKGTKWCTAQAAFILFRNAIQLKASGLEDRAIRGNVRNTVLLSPELWPVWQWQVACGRWRNRAGG